MAKMYSLHTIATRPGINREEFERFAAQEYLPSFDMPGTSFHLLKGERGDREGKYAILIVFQSVEVRNEYVPNIAQPSDKLLKVFDAISKEMKDRWDSYAFNFDNPTFTDYIVVE